MILKTKLTVDSLAAHRVLDKLAREQIPVYSAEKTAKNKITFCVAKKDLEKVFAILSGLCYNVTDVKRLGLSRLLHRAVKSVGLLAGCALFLGGVAFAESRILKIEVTGSGAYLEERVREVLTRGGVVPLSSLPKDTSSLSAEILGFPNVDYCAFKKSGGILTVEVEVGKESSFREVKKLFSPAKGKVEEILVVRGTPLVKEGEEVEEGQLLVDSFFECGEERREALVIASVKIVFPFEEVFEGERESALSGAYLKYGEISDVTLEREGKGYLVKGNCHVEEKMNLN